jgi:Transposase domain (DUF772)
VLMALYSMRSERAFCERLNYDLLFKWFLDLPIDGKASDPTTFTKNRDRLLEAVIADRFFAAVVRQAKLRRYVSSDHFSVDGTLLEAWASHKSFKPKDGPGPDSGASGRNPEANFHGEKRSNQTHRSTTDPEAFGSQSAVGDERANVAIRDLGGAAHLLAAQLFLAAADRDRGMGRLVRVDTDHCHETPPRSRRVEPRRALPLRVDSYAFRFRATPRRDPRETLFARKPDP